MTVKEGRMSDLVKNNDKQEDFSFEELNLRASELRGIVSEVGPLPYAL
jgi:hypothetical protein